MVFKVIFLLNLWPVCSFAGWYFDSQIHSGYSQFDAIEGEKPAYLVQLGLGLSGGYQYRGWLAIGATTSFRSNQQVVEVDETVGNRSSQRWNALAPFLLLTFKKWSLRGEYQNTGDLEYTRTTISGEKATYTEVEGYKVSLSHALKALPKSQVGLYFENLSFGGRRPGSSRIVALLLRTDRDRCGAGCGYFAR